MSRVVVARTVALVLGLACSMGAAANTMEPGMYEIVTKMNMGPAGERSRKQTECLTAEEIQTAPEELMQGIDQVGTDCETSQWDFADGVIAMRMTCTVPGGGKASVQANGTYGGTKFSMRTDVAMDMGGMQMKMTNTSEGRRIGDCTE